VWASWLREQDLPLPRELVSGLTIYAKANDVPLSLPKPGVATDTDRVVHWLLARAKIDGRLKQNDKNLQKECKAATGASRLKFQAALRTLPAEYRYERGNSK
jgi:hypothetical protein